MRVGVVFPQTESGTDVGAIREYLQAVEQLGYVHLVAYDHVLGADASTRADWKGPYSATSSFHEPFAFFGFVAATVKLELAPAVIVLPQRQTALVAKQAAEIDILTGGRFRMGVGLGWNTVEFEALGMSFTNKNKRIEEQIALMRRLWTEPVVDLEGRWHRVDRAGLNPLPVQRPIPVWMGGSVDEALKRIARIADGWFAQHPPNENGRATFERFRGWLRENGRDPATFPIEGRVSVARIKGGPDEWVATARAFRDDLRCTHLEVNTMGMGHVSLAEHVKTLERFRDDAKELFS
ncbi:MAG TPA: LLM class F420-dependent oxidoreductase [Candidatus Limnocylindria bacterium]|nr:LLM class F420-dependent oxidoreductase [Candidatus Limnocylindria bacterium]